MNDTIRKFGYPASLLEEHTYWVVLLRPKQVTLGCMVLACKEQATSWGDITDEASRELASVVKGIEAALAGTFSPNRMNYIMLMMVDPFVHFHVIPRYETPREFEGVTFEDPGWPKHPNLTHEHMLAPSVTARLHADLRAAFSRS